MRSLSRKRDPQMPRPLRYQPVKNMWEPAATAAVGGPTVRIGARTVAISDVRSAGIEHKLENDLWGVLLIGVASLLGAVMFVTLVNVYGWRTRFLLASMILFVFGMVSLFEAMRARPVQFVRLRIETRSGEVLFTTVDEADALRLMAAVSPR